jgi:Acyl dehydratase
MTARKTIADMSIGLTATHEAVVDAETVAAYARLCGDFNPVHVDEAYAATTRFDRPIAHGLLVASYLQTALTSLVAPGGVSVNYAFTLRAPVPVGSRVTARATCSHIDSGRRRARFTLAVVVEPDTTVALAGEAEIAFPREEHP